MPRSRSPKLEIRLTALDKITAPIKKISRSIERMTSPIRRVRNSMRALGRAAGLDRLTRGVGRLRRRFGTLQSAVGGLARKLAIFGGLGIAATLALQRIARVGGNIADVADKLGLATESLQALRFAAGQFGIASNQFDMAFQRITRRAAEGAADTGEAREALKFLGVQLRDTNGQIRDSEAIFRDVADAIQKVENPALRLRLGFKLFDSEGVGVVTMLRNGSKGLDEMASRARRLGIIVGDETVGGLKRVSDGFTIMFAILKSVGLEIVGKLSPAIEAITQRLLTWWEVSRAGVLESFQAFIDRDLLPTLSSLWTVLKEIAPPTLDFIKRIGGLKTVLVVLAAVALAPVLAALIAIAGALGPIGIAAVAVGAIVVRAWKPITEFLSDTWDWIQKIADFVPGGRIFLSGLTGMRIPEYQSAGDDAPAAAGGTGAGPGVPAPPVARSQIGGKLRIELDDRRARVASIESVNSDFEIEVDSGPMMLPAMG